MSGAPAGTVGTTVDRERLLKLHGELGSAMREWQFANARYADAEKAYREFIHQTRSPEKRVTLAEFDTAWIEAVQNDPGLASAVAERLVEGIRHRLFGLGGA